MTDEGKYITMQQKLCLLVFCTLFGVLVTSCVTLRPIPTSRIDEPLLGSEGVTNVQFGALYHFTPIFSPRFGQDDWNVDFFHDSKWSLLHGISMTSPLLNLKFSPFERDPAQNYSDCFNVGVSLFDSILTSSRFDSFVFYESLGYESKIKVDSRQYFHTTIDFTLAHFDKIGIVPFEYSVRVSGQNGFQISDSFALEYGVQYHASMNTATSTYDFLPLSFSLAGYQDIFRLFRVTLEVEVFPFETLGDKVTLYDTYYTMQQYVVLANRLDVHAWIGWYY